MRQHAAQVLALLVQMCSKHFNMSTLYHQALCQIKYHLPAPL